MKPSMIVDPSLGSGVLRAALVWGRGITMHDEGAGSETGPFPFLDTVLEKVKAAGESFLPPERKAAVRGVLRFGTYKPSGRSKPSSEYLLAAALAGDFPRVNRPVDVNNAVSLAWGYPASVFDLSAAGPELLLRRGKPGESYTFNSSGQVIDLEDLLLVCRKRDGAWEPCGNPVKDSMATKVQDGCAAVAAVVYAPASENPRSLEECAETYAALLRDYCGAGETRFEIIAGT